MFDDQDSYSGIILNIMKSQCDEWTTKDRSDR
jgi:hypothetical protein